MDLFAPHLRKKECKYLIYDNNEFIQSPPMKSSVNIQFTRIIDLFTLCLRERSINI